MTDEQAAAVADALLGGPWRRPPALIRATHALGLMLAPPWLAAGLGELDWSSRPSRSVLFARLRRLGPPADPAPDAAAPPQVPWSRAPVALADVGELMRLLDLTLPELEWFCDPRGLQRSVAEPLRHYRWHTLPRPHGVRLVAAPKPRMKEIHRRLLRHVLAPLPLHPAAHGGVPGRSVRTALEPHAGRGVLLRCDLRGFFDRVTLPRVRGTLEAAGYARFVARPLAELCTVATPDPLRHLGSAGRSLPVGAPSSTALANLACFRLDRRLTGLAVRHGAAYTRYVDDLTFSAPRLAGRAFLGAVRAVVEDEGFELVPAKNRIAGRGARQQALGAVVNVRPTLPRPERDRLRATIHNCVVHGPSTQADEPDALRARLAGQVAWAGGLDPVLGARLRAQLERIDWTR